MRQNGGYFDRQKADLIFAGAAGSRISERSPLPLRGTMAGAVGDHGIRGAVRFSDDLQLLRPPAHSTGTAVRHSLFSAKNTQAVPAAPYNDGCRVVICAEVASGAALCLRGALLCGAACGEHFPAANMDPLQPFLVLPERSGVVSFGTGFSVCHLSPASRRTEKGRCPQAALHCRRDLLRAVSFLPCGLESRAQRKGRLLPDLSVPCVPGGRFYHQLLHGLPLPQPQTGERPAGRCFLPAGACRCAACGRLPVYRRQAGGGSGRGGLPVQRAVHTLCGAAGLAACRGQGNHFPAAFRKAVFVDGRAVPLRFSDPSGADPVYGVDCGQVQPYGTSCGLDPDRISAHALPEQLLQGAGAPGTAAPCKTISKTQGRCTEQCAAALFGSDDLFFTSRPPFWW